MAEDTEVLSFTLDIDGKRAQAQVAAVQKKFKNEMGRMAKSTLGVNKLTDKLKKVSKQFGTDYAKGLKLSWKQVDQLNDRLRTLNQNINNNRIATATAQGAQLKALNRNIKAYEKEIDMLKEVSKLQKTANLGQVFEEATEEMGKELRDEVESAFKSIVKYKWSDSGAEIGEGFADAVGSLGSRDLGGMAKGFLKGLGGGLKGLGAGATRFAAKKAADPNAGAMGKAMGAVMGKMGPMIQTVAKLGPILSTVSSLFMAVVKIIIDAEAAAKEFNKELLSSASTTSFLAKNAGDSNAAMKDLSDTVNSIRDSAVDLDNLQWGINKKDHLAVLNTMTAEGVSLGRIKQEADAANKSVGDFSANMTHVAVAYSRNFGVSLGEIANLQTEMMTEFGSSFGDVQKQFAAMELGAEQSGIASNKFFNIIKGVSSDLSLYNMRMEDAVHMLTLLGKVMSPRNAQKFLQTSMQGFKTMGRAEKLRMTLLAGQGATKEIVERDLNRKAKSLADKISEASQGKFQAAEIEKAIKSGGAEAQKMLAFVPDEMKGEFSEGIKQIQIDSKRSKKGLFGLSTATGNLGAGGVFEMYKKSIGKFGGGKSLEDAAGTLGGEMMAENLGVSQQQLDQAIMFEQAINDQKDALIKQGWDKKKVDSMETDEVLDTMSKDDKDLLMNAGKQIDYAKKQADLTSSILDKLDTIIDYIFNLVYKAISGVWDTVVELWDTIDVTGKGAKKREKENLKKLAIANRIDGEMVEAIDSAKDADQVASKLLETSTVKELKTLVWNDAKQVSALHDQSAALSESAADKRSKGDLVGAAKDEAAAMVIDKQLKATNDSLNAVSTVMTNQLSIAAKNGKDVKKMVHDAAVDAGMADDKAWNAGELVANQGKTMQEALVGAGADTETMAKTMDKMLYQMAPADLTRMLSDLKKNTFAGKYLDDSKGNEYQVGRFSTGAEKEKELAKEKESSAAYVKSVEKQVASKGGAAAAPTTGATSLTSAPKTAAGTPAVKPAGPPVPASSKDAPPTGKQAEASNDTLADIHKEAIAAKKFDKGSGANSLKGKIEDATLESVRTALFEYYLYSGFDRKDVAAAMAGGKSIKDITEKTMDLAKKQGSTFNPQTAGVQLVEPNAAGGTVMRPAPGEAFASVAPGETIVPKGGKGGAAVIQNFNGPPSAEFESYIKNGTIKLIAEYERRKKFQ